jgi:DNA-binding NtrC family response regulator
MPSYDRAITLLAGLRGKPHFEDAATVFLRAIMETAQTGGGPSSSRVLRAMVHDRPIAGYRRLAVLNADAKDVSASGANEAFLPSATAWRWLVENRQPASIDVNLAMITAEDPSGPAAAADPPTTGTPTDASRLRMLERGATHVYVLPLVAPSGSVSGLVSIEAQSPEHVGERLHWSQCTEELQVLAAVAGPFLTELPMRPSGEAYTDELLPVAGETMSALVRVLRVFREQRETVLVSGPTGSGKSRLARWCHHTSGRGGGPFETLDLSSIPEDLQMGELFGWRRGAFTGAHRDNPGALGRAEGGTLFIDEIDKLSLRAQAGLLHVLEERSYRALGDTGSEQKTDVRFIVGTNANLGLAVREGRFREDLYYRINVLPVAVPPLAERQDEIAPWAAYMVQRRHDENGGGGRADVTAEGLALLGREAWPGNLRQLDNIVRRAYAFALAEGDGQPQHAVTIGEDHLRRALAYEPYEREPRLLPMMRAAAKAFVEESKRRGPLDLDLAEAFKGCVLAAALEADPDRDRVFEQLGKAALVKGRNHHKMLHREIERVEELCRAVSEPTGSLRLLKD